MTRKAPIITIPALAAKRVLRASRLGGIEAEFRREAGEFSR